MSDIESPAAARLLAVGTAEPPRGPILHSAADFGSFLRACREDAGMTQVELAAHVGFSRKWVSEAENGKPTVELGRVVAALAHLGLVLRAEPAPAPAFDFDAHLRSLAGE